MQAKATKINRYDQRTKQYRINRLFEQDQKRVYLSCMKKLKVAKRLTQKKVEYFGALFGKQKIVTVKLLNG